MKKSGSGWKGESRRHSLARKGIKTKEYKFTAIGIDIDKLNLHKRISKKELNEKMQYLFYYDADGLECWVKQWIEEMFFDEDPEEFEVVDVVLWGSYTKNEEKQGSDLDFLLTYNGTAREDGLFNWINHDNPEGQLTITDRYGNEIKIDVTPINLYNESTTEEELLSLSKMEEKSFKSKGKSFKKIPDKEVYNKWNKLVNMSASELEKFIKTDEGKKAGLSKEQAQKQGIKYGKESANWILKMKNTPVDNWTPTMWEWARRQISFISRMSKNRGELYDNTGNKTRKHTSLLIWGHNPEKTK